MFLSHHPSHAVIAPVHRSFHKVKTLLCWILTAWHLSCVRSCGTSEKSEGSRLMLGCLHSRSGGRQVNASAYLNQLAEIFVRSAPAGQLAKATGKLIPLSPEQLVECDDAWLKRIAMMARLFNFHCRKDAKKTQKQDIRNWHPPSFGLGKLRQQLCWWKGLSRPQL